MTTSSFVSTGSSGSASPSASTGFIVFSPSASLLWPIILDMTKPFYIEKLVTSAENTTNTKILKDTIWIAGILFPSLDKTWQYMLGISDWAQ